MIGSLNPPRGTFGSKLDIQVPGVISTSTELTYYIEHSLILRCLLIIFNMDFWHKLCKRKSLVQAQAAVWTDLASFGKSKIFGVQCRYTLFPQVATAQHRTQFCWPHKKHCHHTTQ